MKYIIELVDEPIELESNGHKFYEIEGFPTCYISERIVSKLTSLKQWEINHCHEIDKTAQYNYREGMLIGQNEAWELVQFIEFGMGLDDYQECFGTNTGKDVYTRYTYQEAKTKYEVWKKQKEEIKVGDEIECISGNFPNAVVTYVTSDVIKYMFLENKKREVEAGEYGKYSGCYKEHWKRTGKHFPEITELFEKMKGE